MAQAINKLSAQRVKTEKRPGRYADGGGLYLQVNDVGAKSWLFRFSRVGKARQMGLGSLATVGLAEAREKALGCRKLLQEGIDPIEQRISDRAQRNAEPEKIRTFQHCAEGYIKAHEKAWKSDKHVAQWTATLKAYAYPHIGALTVKEVDTSHVMDVLEPIWNDKTETASRVRGRIESVLDWAAARKYRSPENPARWVPRT